MELLDIEKDLAGTDRDAALERYDSVLKALAERLAAAQRQGMPPDEFARAKELAEAVVVARKLLRLQVREAAEAAGAGLRSMGEMQRFW